MDASSVNIGSNSSTNTPAEGDFYNPGSAVTASVFGKKKKKKHILKRKFIESYKWTIDENSNLYINLLNLKTPDERDKICDYFYNFFLEEGIILESINNEKNTDKPQIIKFIRKTMEDFGFQLKMSLAFGAGVTGFWKPLYSFIIERNPQLSIEDIVLLFVSAFSFAFINKKDLTKLQDLLTKKGLEEFGFSIKQQFTFIKDKINHSIDALSEVGAYTSAFVPLWDIAMKSYLKGELTLKCLYSTLLGFGLSVSILGLRNFIKSYFKKETDLKEEAYMVDLEGAYWLNKNGKPFENSKRTHIKQARDVLGNNILLKDITGEMNQKGFIKILAGDNTIFIDDTSIKSARDLSIPQIKWLQTKRDEMLINTQASVQIMNWKGQKLYI